MLEVRGDEATTDVGDDRDKRVMADGILPCIKVEVDCGYNHHEQGGLLPVLDVEVWIGKGKDGRLKILHSHYMKKMSSRLVMMSRSAHGNNTKRNAMVSEGCRILKNCSMYLPWVDVAAKVSEFVRRMESADWRGGVKEESFMRISGR